jgi:metal-responsive CopG/Arc/MetJ family transcriptional regulator
MGRHKLSKKADTLRVGFTITEDLWVEFIALAERRGYSHSELFRKMLERFFTYAKDQEEKEAS